MTNQVTEYKVKKAIEAGSVLDTDALVEVTKRPEHEVRQVLVKLYPEKFGIPGVNVSYRTTATIDELVDYAREIVAHQGIQAVVDWEHWPQACGCTGPQDGNPLCSCGMSSELARHKAAVVAQFMAEQGVGD